MPGEAAAVLPQATAAQDAMELRARLFAIALGIAVLLFVVNLVRTRKLKEEFALLWLLTAVVLVLAPLLIDYLDMMAHALGIEYPPALIFVLAIICVLLVLFQFSMRISHFSEQIKVLTQELALLRARLESLEQSLPRGTSGLANPATPRTPPRTRDAVAGARSAVPPRARDAVVIAENAGRSTGNARRSSGLAKNARRRTGPATDPEGIDVNAANDA
jgi:hypothetical protein